MNNKKSFKESIEEVKNHIQNISLNFDPEKCEFFTDTKTDKNYSVVVPISESISEKINKIAQKLKTLDSSLILNPKNLYHLTIFYLSYNRDLNILKKSLKNFLSENKFNFKLNGLIVGQRGISIGAFPTNKNFITLRKKLSEDLDFFPPNFFLMEMCWITIARFSKKPNTKLVKYLQNNLNKNFGDLKVESVDIFLSDDKNLQGSKKLYSIAP